MPTSSDDFENPYELLTHLWQRLHAAVADRASPWHVATFCTNGADGHPAARSIILRDVLPQSWQIRFHTDRRSPKVQEVLRDARAAMLFWDPSSRTQLRLAGTAQVLVDDELTRSLIASAKPGSLAVYRSIDAPSTPIESCHATTFAAEPILGNVAVLSVRVDRLEWLWLDDAGHRRCQFTNDGARVSHQWLVP